MRPDYGRKIDLDQYTDFALLESSMKQKGWGLWSIYLLEQDEVFLFARKIREKLDKSLEIHPVPMKDNFSLMFMTQIAIHSRHQKGMKVCNRFVKKEKYLLLQPPLIGME